MTLEDIMKEVLTNLENSVKALTISVQQLDQAARKIERTYSKPRLVVDNTKEAG